MRHIVSVAVVVALALVPAALAAPPGKGTATVYGPTGLVQSAQVPAPIAPSKGEMTEPTGPGSADMNYCDPGEVCTGGGGGSGPGCTDPFACDMDGDGMVNAYDNCQEQYNPGWADTDQDGVGDACDDWPNNWPSWQYLYLYAYGPYYESEPGALSLSVCHYVRGYYHAESNVGIDLFGYNLDFHVCARGGLVTKIDQVHAYSAYAHWPYDFKGNDSGSPSWGGVGARTASVFTQGAFAACVWRWGCVRTYHPYITAYVNGSLQYAVQTGLG